MKPTLAAILKALFFVFALSLLLTQVVAAQSTSDSDYISTTYLPIDETMEVSQFDPSLGILTSVGLTATANMSGTFAYENPLPSPNTVEGDVEGNVQLLLPASQILQTTSDMLTVNELLNGFGSGEEAFAAQVGENATLTDAASLDAFTGNGVVSIPALVWARWNAAGINSNVDIRLRTTGNARLDVVYNYAIPQIELQKLTNNADADNANQNDVPQVAPGDAVTWVYLLENVGNVAVPQNRVVLTDSDPAVTPVFDAASDAGGDGVLSPGETWRYTATGTALNLADSTATQNSTIVQGCNQDGTGPYGTRPTYENTATVTVPGAESTDPSHYCNPAVPDIDIETSTNGVDADSADDPNAPVITPGDPANWVYVVRNDGNVSFTVNQVVVTDSYSGVTPVFDPSSDDGDGILSPGESWRYTASAPAVTLVDPVAVEGRTVVPGCSTAGTDLAYENVGRVVVPGAEDSDPTHYCNPIFPSIDIETSTNGADADDKDDPNVPVIAIGETADWVYIVRNDGNVTFTVNEVQVTDSRPGVTPVFDPASDDGDGILSPGESWRYTASGPVLDLDDAEATADSTIVLGCSATGTRNTYTNVGTVVVPGADDTDPTHHCNPANPAIDIETSTNGADADDENDPTVPRLSTDGTANWVYIVRNDGNVTFSAEQVDVTDSRDGVTPVFDPAGDDGDGLLSPGESWRYTATGAVLDLADPAATDGVTIVLGCSDDGRRYTYENVGTVVVPGDDDTDPTHYCNPAAPAVNVEKATNGADADDANDEDIPTVVPGATVVWEYVVTNTGNLVYARSDVALTDSDGTLTLEWIASSDDGDGLLSPGESWRYTATGAALDLNDPAAVVGQTVVSGCSAFGTGPRPTYNNVATVTVPGANDTDASHYCSVTPTAVDLHSFRATADGDAIKVAWSFSNPVNSLGFRVVRSTTPAYKDAAAVTTNMVLTETGLAQDLHEYDVTDSAVLTNVVYYYWLVEHETSGSINIYGPVQGVINAREGGHQVYLPLASRR